MELLHKSGDIIAQKYRIKSTLGQGGIGITYQAIDLQNNKLVAIKTLSLRRMTDWKALELFERESKILSQLNHPGIPYYLDYFQVETENDRTFYLVQQLAEGTSLANWIENGWIPQESEVKDIAIQVLEIIAYLQTLTPPIIHRDIKPQNIILREDGQVFLVDFGAVQDVYHQTITGGSTVVGTYGYMAPEQFRGQAVLSTDLYGLGTTLLFLLTQKSPADLPQRRLKINFRSHVRISQKFANWLERMIEPETENRFDSAQEALAVFQGKQVLTSFPLQRNCHRKPSLITYLIGGIAATVIAGIAGFKFINFPILKSDILKVEVAPSGMCQAIAEGNMKYLRDYLTQGGNPDALVNDSVIGWLERDISLLSCASFFAKKDAIELLIAKGVNVNARNSVDGTALHYAMITLKSDWLSSMLCQGLGCSQQITEAYNPKQVKEVVALLIANGADVNAQTHDERNTPLHILVRHTKEENKEAKAVAKLLIINGANVNLKDRVLYGTARGRSPFELVVQTRGKDWDDVVKLMIDKGADVNVVDENRRTALHYANSKEIAQLLIAKGADVNAKDNCGITPLHYAKSKEIAQLLIAKEADVNAKDNKGITPLHAASGIYRKYYGEYYREGFDRCVESRDGNKEVAALLVAKGANINARDNQGITPLTLLREKNWDKELEKLLKSHDPKK